MNSEPIIQFECDSYFGKCQGIINDFLSRIMNDSTSSVNVSSSRDLLFTNLTIENLCKCIYFVNECASKTNLLDSWIKNIYLTFYVALEVAGLFVIFLTFGLLINDHKRLNPIEVYKNIHKKFEKKRSVHENSKTNTSHLTATCIKTHIRRLNAASDFLIICLLFSYLLIILYVVPNQAYLFYFNKNVLTSNCKSSEFLKAFAVSFSIYCLVAVALQRLFAIKFGQLVTPINTSLIYSINYQSFLEFTRSSYDLVNAFFFSSYYRQYLTTTLLAISKWLISISIGLYNMSLYSSNSAQTLDDSSKHQFAECVENTISSSACKRNNNEESISDIIFVVVLLLMPNLIVFSSYSWICYHVYSNGIKFKKSVQVILLNSSGKHRKLSKEKNNKLNFNDTYSDKHGKKITDIELKENTKLISTEPNQQTQKATLSKNGAAQNFNSIQLHANQLLNTNSQISINRRNKSVILTTCLMVICFTICWYVNISLKLFLIFKFIFFV